MDALKELKGFNTRNLILKTEVSDDDFEQWLLSFGLLHKPDDCPICGGNLNRRIFRGVVIYRCTTKTCRKAIGLRVGSYFWNHKLTMKEMFKLTYFWCRDTHNYEEYKHDLRRENGKEFG